jgi:hypothetical protein
MEYEMEAEQSPRGHKRHLEEEEAEDPSRLPTKRRLAEHGDSPSPSLSVDSADSTGSLNTSSPGRLPPQYPTKYDDDWASDGEGKTPPGSEEGSDVPAITNELVQMYRDRGAVYQAWIADPARAGCPVQLSEVTVADLFRNKVKQGGFRCLQSEYSRPKGALREDLRRLGLPITKQYRHTELMLFGVDKQGYKRYSEYSHFFATGVFIAESIFRYTGPNWSDVALAQYKYDHDVNTLKHLYYVNVINEQTLPYVRNTLYPRHNLAWSLPNQRESHTWEYGTREYQEILGTQLGKAAACVVLGAWDRGTHRIARIVTDVEKSRLHMRFDFEAIPTPGAGHGVEAMDLRYLLN